VKLASDHYKSLKDERSVLDFDDLETLTYTLLRDDVQVAKRYSGGEFQHVMVDEFQDTNERQRAIVYHLCGVRENEAPPGRLFVVGDPKQSIYAFRGADVSVFNEVRHDITHRMQGEDLPLSESFRTHHRLVDCFNVLFSRVLIGGAGYEVVFDKAMTAFRAAESYYHHQKPVELIVLEKTGDSEQDRVENRRRWEAYEIALRIHAMIEQKIQIYDKEKQEYRAIQYGDVAILLRVLTNAVVYEEVFKALNLPYVTIAGRGYYDRQEVWDMLNLLRALHNPSDNLALASVLRSPMFGLSDDALFALRLLRDDDGKRLLLWDAIDIDIPGDIFPAGDRAPLEFARECLHRLAGLAGRVTVEELLEAALDETAYDAILTALPDGNRRRGNLDKLLQKARSSGRVSLNEFMLYVGELTGIEPREGEAVIDQSGAVQIMSVHKSKGLEFPVVVLANADWTPRNYITSPLLMDSEIGAACFLRDSDDQKIETFAYQEAKRLALRRDAAEHKRLFYVGATRAQDYLILSGRGDEDGSWLKMFLDAMQSEPDIEDFVNYELKATPPPENILNPTSSQGEQNGWYALKAEIPVKAQKPPLVDAIPERQETPARHLSVTQLEQLGSIQFYNPHETGGRIFRNSIQHDAPDPIRPILRDEHTRLTGRIVGRMVHRALQVGALRYQDRLDAILRAYAWNENVTNPEELDEIVSDAFRLLMIFQERGEPQALKNAERVLREVPFIYQHNGRILHGIIDVLYQYQEQWYVLDYKTASISERRVNWHAQRYYIQLGAYAHAVEARTGQIPIVQLYYLHPSVLIHIAESQWRKALSELDYLVESNLTP
ncbi:MAG TPA: 3'-5' exonuclease, partial [Aggregatilineales bacterium]|nr:3'-5' exonuclease [Aggregatilineales bacterium]